jgi:hypothetical protein
MEERHAEPFLELVAGEPDNPLHSRFTWDNERAAHFYRLHEARNLLNSIRVRIVEEDAVYERPAFYSVQLDEASSRELRYVRYTEAANDPALEERILTNARRDMRAFKSRYDKHREVFVKASPEMAEILRLADEVLQD